LVNAQGRSRLEGRVSLEWWENALTAALALVFLTGLATDNGGYSATTWGWSALVLFWATALALLLRKKIRLRRIELIMPSAFLALFGWILLSTLWTSSRTQTVLESERLLVYIAGCSAAIFLVRSQSYRALLGGAWGAITLVCGYALLTKLFPERLAYVDPLAGPRLFEPVGYWNALGIFAALGILLALGLAARARGPFSRALGAASLAVLLPTLYFTFSRGSWIALGAGFLAALALDPRRLQLVTVVLLVGAGPAAGVWLASQSPGLTRFDASLAAATDEGQHLAVVLVGLAVAAGIAALAYAALEHRVRVPTLVRRAYAAGIVLLCFAVLITVFAHYGSPPTLARKAYHSFTSPPPAATGSLNKRLFSLSSIGRPRQWRVAWDDYKAHPLLGSGAGTYEQQWLRRRPDRSKVIDAHSLYLETLTELGPIGLALLLTALGLPLVAAIGVRARPPVPAAYGAYVAYLLHAGIDWDWEVTGVTLAALFCGSALLVAARRGASVRPVSKASRIAALAMTGLLASLAFIGLVGNAALSAAHRAASDGKPVRAEVEARKASHWAPWSSTSWQQLAAAQFAQGEQALARQSLAKAIAKDSRNWRLWYELSLMSTGRTRTRALAEAARLNPLQPELAQFRSALKTPR
jgi:O-antigen ligase